MKILEWLFGKHDAPDRFDLPSYRDPIKAPKVQIKHLDKVRGPLPTADSVIEALSGEWNPNFPKVTQGPLTYCPYITIESSKKSKKMDEKPIEVSNIPPIFNDAYIKMLKKITPPPPPNSRRVL